MSKTNIKNTSVPSAYDTPMTTLEYLRKVESQNAQVLARQDAIEEALDGKVAKAGDTMTGDLSVPNISIDSNANVGKLNSEKINQKYEGAIKAELHVDEEGITEFVNGSNAGRFDTARVIKPSEVKTEIYDNQEGKRMFFRLPYLEASAGEHRLLTEEDLGGGGSSLLEDIEDSNGHKRFQKTAGVVVNNIFDTNKYASSIVNGLILELVGYIKSTNGGSLAGNIIEYSVPQWVYDLLIADENGIVTLFQAATNSINLIILGLKKQSGKLYVYKPGSASTASAGYELRINLALGL